MSKPVPPVERRHRPRRATDLPPAHHNWLITLIIRNPVTVGMSLALLIASVALVLVLGALHSQGGQQDKLRAFTARSAVDRRHTVSAFCESINRNAAAVNKQTDYLTVILINSVKESRPFEPTFRRLGLPSYAKRLAEARKTSSRLVRLKVPILGCDAYVRQVEQEAP